MRIALQLGQRLLQTLIVMWLVATAVFFLFRVVPGDPSAVALPLDATFAEREAYRQSLGLDRPIVVQYGDWIGDLIRLDLGVAITRGSVPVLDLVVPAFLRTLELASVSVLVAVIIAVPLGVAAAARPRSWIDRLVNLFSSIGLSLPSFWFGILLLLLLSVRTRILPVGGYSPPADGLVEHLHHLVLPALTVGLITAAVLVRFVREAMGAALGEDFVVTARAKGVGGLRLLYGHVFRNASLPVVSAVALQFGLLVGGMVVVEQVFAWPGIGSLMVQAVKQRAFEITQGAVLLSTGVLVLASFAADALFLVIDPRIRSGSQGSGEPS